MATLQDDQEISAFVDSLSDSLDLLDKAGQHTDQIKLDFSFPSKVEPKIAATTAPSQSRNLSNGSVYAPQSTMQRTASAQSSGSSSAAKKSGHKSRISSLGFRKA